MAELESADRRERSKADELRALARQQLTKIGAGTSPEERVAREEEAARRQRQAAKHERRAATLGAALTEEGVRLRRGKASMQARESAAAAPYVGLPAASYRFDVCLSFADERREYVELVADLLNARGYRVFYDGYEKAANWGRHMTELLDAVFRIESYRCVPFISSEYRRKEWTMWEWRSALDRTRQEPDYLLPARFDQTEMPGLPGSVFYYELAADAPQEFADFVAEKLGPLS